MELDDPNKRAWSLEGATDAPYVASIQRHHAFYVSRALNIFADVCVRIKQRTLAEQLKDARNRFEESGEYPSE